MKSGAWLPHVLSAAALTTTGLLCLAACGETDIPQGGESPSACVSAGTGLHPGTFRATLPNGASVTITVPARETPDKELEQLRRQAGVSRATYATVDIDNRTGRSPVSASRLVLTARDGATYQLEHLARGLKRWQPRPSGERWVTRGGTVLDADAARALTQRISDAAGDATRNIPVGERGRNILVGDISAVPRDFASLELIPLIGDREAAPVQVRPEDRSTNGGPDGSDGPGDHASRGHEGDGSSGVPGDEVPPENPLPDDPQPSAPVSPAVPGPMVPEPVDPPPAVPDPVVPPPVVPDPVVPPPVVPSPVVPDPGVPDPVPTVPPVPVPEPPEPEPSVPGNALPDPPAPGPVEAGSATAGPVEPQSAPAAALKPPRAAFSGALPAPGAVSGYTGAPVSRRP